MRRLTMLFALVAAVPAQEPGRDTGDEGPVIHFVRWHRTMETGAIYRSAWAALEPHLVGKASRRRLVDFDGDPERARAHLARDLAPALVIAFDRESAEAARAALPEAPVLEVSPAATAHVSTVVPRERLAVLLRELRPGARRVAVLAAEAEELPGFETKACRTAADAAGRDLAWLPEDGTPVAGALPPLVTTADPAPLPAVLTVRPDSDAAGLKVAALALGLLRDGRPLARRGVLRLHVTVDLDAAREAGIEVPLRMLARADAVRRAP